MFKGDLQPSRKAQSGYGAMYKECIDSLKALGDDIDGGPCKLDISDGAPPVSEQLWPYAQKIIVHAGRMMKPLLKLEGVRDDDMSPF